LSGRPHDPADQRHDPSNHDGGGMTQLTVGAGVAGGLIALAVGKGASEAALLARSGIDPALLADQDNRIAMSSYLALMRAAQELANDPAIALHYGEEIDLSEVSITGLITNSSETMMHAFIQLNRFGRLTTEVETGASERFELVSEGSEVWMVDTRSNPN